MGIDNNLVTMSYKASLAKQGKSNRPHVAELGVFC